MAQTNLRGRAVVEKLNSMAVDLIPTSPDIVEDTYSDGDLMTEEEYISNAVAVTGGTCILQSITAIDTSDTGGAIRIIITDNAANLGSRGDAVNAADGAADNSMAIVDLTNWVDIGGAKVCTKGNLGIVMKSISTSRDLRYGVVNISGGDIVIGSGEDIIVNFGVVKD
tara:strand:+ start:12302 stop:12805 length:504 start_codon:yes stop_codon:yes gene_type:complete